jgi:hypothetical protein
MKKVVALLAPKPRSVIARNAAWVYAGILTVMAVGQLFAFEKFIPMLQEYEPLTGVGAATVVASLIVIAEVFTLPFLVRMRLSPLMRWVGLVLGVSVPAFWLVVSASGDLWAAGSMFGSYVHITNLHQLVASIVLLAVSVYVARGLWPETK